MLESNDIGKAAINQLKEKDVKPLLNYEYQRHSNRGRQWGKSIELYMQNIPNAKVAAQTVIHEATHLYYDIGQSQWVEAICFAHEKMFLTGRALTVAERRYIVGLAKSAYPEYKWKRGGYEHK